MVRGLKTPKVLKFVTVSFPMSRLFAIIAETRNVLFWSLHLWQVKIESLALLGLQCKSASLPN